MSQRGSSVNEVCPFQGIRYDAAVAGDLSSLLCPPYDIITPELQRELYLRDPHNMVRIEHPLPLDDQYNERERYRTAATTFQQWMRQGILFRDPVPALYVHDHSFEYLGERHVRRGVVGAVRLRSWYEGVYPHELTGAKAKQDRLELMRECGATFSYPLGLYEDREGLIAQLLDAAVDTVVPLEVSEPVQHHRLWTIRDQQLLVRLQQAFTSEPIYIADGHHRYETGLSYQAERRGTERYDSAGDYTFDYIPMTLTAFGDRGLFISPVYRVLSGLQLPDTSTIEKRLSDYFCMDYVPVEKALVRSAPAGEKALMAVVGLREGWVAELRPRPGVDIGAEVPGEHSREYRSFNVSVLNHVIMRHVLEVNPDGEGVAYSPDLESVVHSVQLGEAQMAFLLAPADPFLVKKIADQHERMPRKSTYFYPKPPTGLVAYSLD